MQSAHSTLQQMNAMGSNDKPQSIHFVFTQGIVDAVSIEEACEFLERHLDGDWGDIDSVDRQINEQSLARGVRNVLSRYTGRSGSTVEIVSGYRRISMRLAHEYTF